MNHLTYENKGQTAPSGIKLGLLALVIIGAMFGIELGNAVRIWMNPASPKTFPHRYVSKGIWSFGAFIRRLDSDSTDFSSALISTYKAFHGNPNLYGDFRLEGCSFLYSPAAIIELLGFAHWVRPPDFSIGIKLGDLTGRLCVLATIAIAAWFLRPIIHNKKQWAFAILILAAFFPLRWSVMCVNVQSFITFFLAVLILAYAKSHNLLAGVMIGLAACLKPYLGLLVLFAVFRKQWKFIFGAVATASLLILLSVIVVGVSPWKTYFFDLLPVVARGYGYYPNHSINGIVHRWLGHPTSMVVGPESTIVFVATRISAIVFIGLSVLPRPIKQGKHRRDIDMSLEATTPKPFAIPQDVLFRAADIAIAILAVTLVSPIVWDHYYAWCVVLFSICLAISSSTILSSRFVGLLICSYILLGTYFLTVRSATSGLLTLINSTHFFGAILLLGAAWYAQLRLHRMGFS